MLVLWKNIKPEGKKSFVIISVLATRKKTFMTLQASRISLNKEKYFNVTVATLLTKCGLVVESDVNVTVNLPNDSS